MLAPRALYRPDAALIRRLSVRRGRDVAGHPVDHDIRQQLVLGVGLLDVAVVIAPPVVLLEDPGRETDRRIV